MRQKHSCRRLPGAVLACISITCLIPDAGAQAPPSTTPAKPQAAQSSPDARKQYAAIVTIFEAALNLQRTGKATEARSKYQEYIRAVNSYHLPPRVNIPAYMNLAQMARAQRNPAEESKQLELVLQIDPKNAQAMAQLSTSCLDQKRYTEAVALARRALELKPPTVFAAASHYTLGVVAAQKRDYATAEREFSACLHLVPDNPETALNYARILDYEKKYAVAFEVISRVAAAHPQDIQLQLFRAYLAASTHQYPLAIATYNQIIERDSRNAAALFGRAAAYQSMGRLDDAIDAFLSAVTVHPEDLQGQANLAQLYYQKGNYVAAKNHFAQAVKLNPRDAHMLDRLALCQAEDASRLVDVHLKGAELAEAEANFKRAMELAPNDIVVEDSLAYFYARVGRYPDAAAIYHKEIAQHPDHPEAYASLARMFELNHRTSDAIAAWEEYRTRYPDEMYSYNELSRLHMSLGHFDQAAAIWKAYLTRRPKDPGALVALGQIQAQQGKYSDARATYGTVLDADVTGDALQNPRGKGAVLMHLQNRLQALYGLANVAHGEKKISDEVGFLRQAIQLENASATHPGTASHEGYKTLAGVYEQNKMIPQAEGIYEEWAKQDPSDSTPLTLLARLQDRSGQSAQAEANLDKAASLSHDPSALIMERAEVYHRNRDLEKAIALYQDVLKHNPNDSRVFSPLAQLYDQSSQFDKGLQMWRSLVKTDKTAEWANDHVATDLVRLKRYEEARTVYVAELDAHPQNAQTYADVARTYELEGKLDQYLPFLQARLQKTPAELSLMSALLAEYTRLKRTDEGWATLQKAADAAPDPNAADTSLALLYLKNGKTTEGLAEYKRIADRKPDDLNQQSFYAQQLYANGRTEEAIKEFNAILARKNVPKETQISIRRQLIAWYEHDQKHQDSIAQARAILALSPGDFVAMINLADLLSANGGEAEAANLFLEVSKNQSYPAAIRSQLHVRVGDIYLKLNRSADATAQYQEAIKIAPDNAMATAALKKVGGGQ